MCVRIDRWAGGREGDGENPKANGTDVSEESQGLLDYLCSCALRLTSHQNKEDAEGRGTTVDHHRGIYMAH